jgi:TM2 domain-containing membrane protein YozV
MSQETVPLRRPYWAAFLAWLIPGLGHFYQGRNGKGWLYAICILGLYLTGFLLGEGKIVYWRWVNPLNNPEKFCLYYLGQFFVGLPALPALIQGTVHYLAPDQFPLLGGFMAEPTQTVLNGLQPRLSKLVEIGTIYTTVAGLLNILAIYDAFEGPAYLDAEVPADATLVASASASCEPIKAGGSA